MRTFILAFWVASGFASQPDFQAPGGGPVEIQTAPGDRVTVTSRYWRAGFDLRNGGGLDSIVFLRGSGKNLLREPLGTYVDTWSDRNAPNTEFRSSRDGDMVTLKFSGRLAGAGRVPGPVGFETTWTLSPFVIRADHTLRFSEDLPVSVVGVGSTTLRPDISEWGLRVGPADDRDERKQAPADFGDMRNVGGAVIAEHHAPLYLLFFQRGVEGLDFTAASDLATWESGLTGRAGLGRYEARPSAEGIEIRREPLHSARPLQVRKGEYTFSYYLGLPRIVEKANRKWRHLSFGNQPWPTDAEVARWAENGVNIARLHNDYMPDGNFWHDGAWPPYDEKGMAEMRRVIAACHRHGILVAPYFSLHEFHPLAEGYKEHETEWKRTNDQSGSVYHNRTDSGEFGAQMCPQSGWLERRKRDIERAYRELGFDGIYYDWIMSLPCNNQAHNARLHAGTDGVLELLAWTRRLIAPKNGVLIVHLYGKMPSIAFENFGDLVVNMEEISEAAGMMRMGEAPLPTVLAESIPRSPCPSYREDRALERNRNNIAQLVVLGMFPWAGATPGPVLEETLRLFRAFKPYKLEELLLRDAFSGAIRTAWPDVYGALYAGPEYALAVISNTSNAARKNVVWTVRPDLLGFRAARLSLRDTASGMTQEVDASALDDGSLTTALGPYEYRIFEIRQAPAPTAYYVDSARGSDQNDGISPARPWKTLAKVNSATFRPGDRLLLGAGSRFSGQLRPKGSGTETSPIVIDLYGQGEKPLIAAEGKYHEALLLENQDYWEVNNLELTNAGGTRAPFRYGVRVRAWNHGSMRHIQLKNLFVHDVNGSLVKQDAGEGHGIVWENGGEQIKSRFDGLLIEGCRLLRTDRNGICGYTPYASSDRSSLSRQVVIRRNLLEDIGGDAIKVWGCDGALVEHNIVRGARRRCNDYAAGIWPWASDNTVIQFNEVSGLKGMKDGEAFDSDAFTTNTIFQYNYSHDNDGGFMLICCSDNTGTIVRYNVSRNDHSRLFHLADANDNVRIYNNVFYIGKGDDVQLFLWTGRGSTWTRNAHIFNNIFYAAGTGRNSSGEKRKPEPFDDGTFLTRAGFGGAANILFEHNVLYGHFEDIPEAWKKMMADPRLIAPDSTGVDGYKLRKDSPAIGAGLLEPQNGGRDFWGNPVPADKNPSIGAYEP